MGSKSETIYRNKQGVKYKLLKVTQRRYQSHTQKKKEKKKCKLVEYFNYYIYGVIDLHFSKPYLKNKSIRLII